jgi:hypothetical protein
VGTPLVRPSTFDKPPLDFGDKKGVCLEKREVSEQLRRNYQETSRKEEENLPALHWKIKTPKAHQSTAFP